jgi:RHS repeat-associated protein
LDLEGGLSQVLSDGTNDYLYGNGRILQANGTDTQYFLGDALGSVRQLTDAGGVVSLAKGYDPFGNANWSAGAAQTPYGYTAEQTDANGLVYLRARYYAPEAGRFVSKDVWQGDYSQPLSLNRWNYVEGNPINRIDPSGYCYTNPNVLSSGFWSRFWDSPFMGPCPPNQTAGNPLPPPVITIATFTPNPDSTGTCTSTSIPMPTQEEWVDLGDFTITHYVTAMETDPYFQTHGPYASWKDQTGYLPGLDQTKKYNLNWAYSDEGIPMQGQGLSSFNEYVTLDWNKSTWKDDHTLSRAVFIYGKGGAYGPPREWETIATGDSRLQAHDWVRIAAYPEKGPFEVLDTGKGVGEKQIDIFIGDKLMSEANALGEFNSKVFGRVN